MRQNQKPDTEPSAAASSASRCRLTLLACAVALALALTGCDTRREAPAPVSDPGSSSLPLDLFDSASGWAVRAGARPYVAGGRATVLIAFALTEAPSLATLSAAEEWSRAYARHGVTVVGVCVPSYEFDADSATVARELSRRGVTFPVALDRDLAIAHRLGFDGALPWLALIEGNDGVTLRAFEPEPIARRMQAIVAGTMTSKPSPGASSAAPSQPSSAPHALPTSVELGAVRRPRGPLADVAPGRPRRFIAQLRRDIDGEPYVPYPVGLWTLVAAGLTSARGGADNFLAFRYDGRPLGVVMSPPADGAARIWLLDDDHWLTREAAGADVRFDERGASYLEVDAPRLYDVRRAGQHEKRLKLSPGAPGITLHAFRFGEIPPAAR